MSDNTRFSENTGIARIVLAVVIILSIMLSGGGALGRLRSDVVDIYSNGIDNDGLCIMHDVSVRSECALNLADLASDYELSPDKISAVKTLASKTGSARDVISSSDNDELTRAVEQLYTEMENCEMSDKDASFALGQYKEFKSRASTMANDPYNDKAMEFNSKLSGLPARLASALGRVAEMPVFR